MTSLKTDTTGFSNRLKMSGPCGLVNLLQQIEPESGGSAIGKASLGYPQFLTHLDDVV